jgi:ribose-phosphate pyrophosphokinase
VTLTVACFADEAEPARRLALALGASLAPARLHRFPDGESLPVVQAPASETVIVYRSLDHPNAKLVELLLAADAWRRSGARRLILVAPYLCYLRQDAVFAPGEPLSRDVICPLIGASFDAVVTVQAHLHRTPDLSVALGKPARNLWAVEPLADALPAYASPPLVIGPDAEAAPWSETWARRLGGEAVSLTKVRSGDRQVQVSGVFSALGRPVVIIDDVASSGETLRQAIVLARTAGAASIDVAVVHALLTPRALRRLQGAGARSVVSTDSVRHPTNAAHLAPLLAHAVDSLIEGL